MSLSTIANNPATKIGLRAADFVLPGISLVGDVIGAVGAGYEGNKALDWEKEKFAQEMALEKRKQGADETATERTLGLKGIETLAGLRDRAMKNYRMGQFRNAVMGGN